MLELLCLFAVIAYIAYIVLRLDPEPVEPGQPRSGSRLSGEADRPRLELAIAGTQPGDLRHRKFVTGFGVNPHAVHDIRIYADHGGLEQIPSATAALLSDLYARGCAVGSDIMDLLFHGRALQEGEAIYFALVEARPKLRIVAFVDKVVRTV